MKNSIYLIILLSLGLVFVSYKWVCSSTNVDEGEPTNPVIENIMTRSSVRSYTDRSISEETLDTLLRAAMAAPTAVNKQPWRFVVINHRSLLDTIAANFNSMGMAREAQAAVVVCGDMSAALDGVARDYWIQDTSAAAENLLLAAHAVGLGAVWCGIYPIPERVSAFSRLLSLPEEIIPLACICLGYPSGNPVPKDKWHPEYIHLNAWPDLH